MSGQPALVFEAGSLSSSETTPRSLNADTTQNKEERAEKSINTQLHADSAELEGLRSVALTPTTELDDNRTTIAPASPPLVFKSVPSTPAKGTFASEAHDDDADEILLPSTIAQHAPRSNGISAEAENDEDDPRNLVISSLRSQISDLFSQVALLNSKLVQSYDRMSNLEETLDENNERLRALEGEKVNLEREKSILEVEKQKHENAIKDGRLVERTSIAEEMNRLMEQSIAAQNAQKAAEAKHAQIEAELSDLSANLFSTANDMVATERKNRLSVEDALSTVKSERIRLEKELEVAKRQMEESQRTVDHLREERELREADLKELRAAVNSVGSTSISSSYAGAIRMMNTHPPYRDEYLSFLAHLRSLVATTPAPPPISSVLTLPFLQRLAVEDSEPTLRLDLAPSLNWLTRRSVLAAVHANTLLIEQIHVATLFLESSASSYSYSSFGGGTSLPTSPTQLTKVSCALCGKVVYMSPEAIQAEQNEHHSMIISQSPTTPTPTATNAPPLPPRTRTDSGGTGWVASKFLKTVSLSSLSGSTNGTITPRPSTPVSRNSLDSPTVVATPPNAMIRPSSPPPSTSLQTVIHAFRIPLANKNASSNGADSTGAENYGPPYPLCHTGWCVSRLRTTCELWGHVNRGVLERVWREARSIDLRLRVGDVSPTGERMEEAFGKLRDPSPTPAKRKAPTFWDMGKNVLDKARGASPISGPSPSDGSKSTLFGGMRRSFSGGRNTSPSANGVVRAESSGVEESPRLSAPAPQRVSSDADSGKLDLGDDMSESDVQELQQDTIKRSSSDSGKRGIARLSALFIAPGVVEEKADAGEKVDGNLAKEVEAPLELAHPAAYSDTSKEIPSQTATELEVPAAPEVDARTPHATTFSEGQGTKDTTLDSTGVNQNATTSHPINAAPDSVAPEVVPEPNQPSADSVEKPPVSKDADRVASPPPSVPKAPITPGKTAPPPVPRRAAARNAAARSSIVAIPKEPEKIEKEASIEPAKEETTSADVKDATATAAAIDETKAANSSELDEKAVGQPITSTVDPPTAQPEETKAPQDQDATVIEPSHSNVSTPKSISMPLPPLEMPSPSRHPVPQLPVFLEKEDVAIEETKVGRSRQQSVVSSSSDYTPSVYTNNSAAPIPDDDGPPVPEKGGLGHEFYVGRTTWEERAWLELVRIRERMFWARLGGVIHSS